MVLEPGQVDSATLTYPNPLDICATPATTQGVRIYPPNQTAALFAPGVFQAICIGNVNDVPGVYPIGDTTLG